MPIWWFTGGSRVVIVRLAAIETKTMPDDQKPAPPTDLQFAWSQAAQDFFVEKRIFLDYPNRIDGIIPLGASVRISRLVEVEPYACMARGQFYSAGAFSYCRSGRMPADFRIGRYCSIGPAASLSYQEHPTDRFTTHPITTHAHLGRMAREEFGRPVIQRSHVFTGPPPVIGNDVWIGNDAVIKRGVTIGDGAVVAARAFVTHDVPPYAIVGGLPAKIIRYRFSPDRIERLMRLRWWDYNFVDLPQVDPADIDRFLDLLEEMIQQDAIKPMANERIHLASALAEVV
jgi:hypothetical protein